MLNRRDCAISFPKMSPGQTEDTYVLQIDSLVKKLLGLARLQGKWKPTVLVLLQDRTRGLWFFSDKRRVFRKFHPFAVYQRRPWGPTAVISNAKRAKHIIFIEISQWKSRLRIRLHLIANAYFNFLDFFQEKIGVDSHVSSSLKQFAFLEEMVFRIFCL